MTDKAYVLNLPYPPSVNHYWGVSGKRRFVAKKGVDFRNYVISLCKGLKTFEGRLIVEVDIYPPDKRKRDIDNLAKGVLDSLQHANVFLDDNQIDRLVLERKEVIKGGSLTVVIREI